MVKQRGIIKQYGRLLYEISQSTKSEAELKKQVGVFAGLLAKKGLLNKFDEIVSDFQEYAAKKEGETEVQITTSRQLNKRQADKIDKAIEKILGRKVRLNLLVEAKILGGLILQIGDKVFDGSLKARLEDLKAQMAC
ncbi:MAG: ATP synthase F1 subunit delta [Candidatus Pacebacteria bacterium]|nr:ATP synthase F1 subunit delta [Candidatus Paceibacterota bacterium]